MRFGSAPDRVAACPTHESPYSPGALSDHTVRADAPARPRPRPRAHRDNPAGQCRHPRNGLGIAALVLGIVAIVASVTVIGGIVLRIIAVILGFIARSRAKKGQATNGGVALAGIITGALGVVLSIVLVVAGAALFFGNGGNDLVTCINNAHGDQTAITQCNNQFQNKVSNGN